MFFLTAVLSFSTLRLAIVCNSESLPLPNPLSIVSIARSSSVGINEGVNSLVNRHKSCPEGYELGTKILLYSFYLFYVRLKFPLATIYICDGFMIIILLQERIKKMVVCGAGVKNIIFIGQETGFVIENINRVLAQKVIGMQLD